MDQLPPDLLFEQDAIKRKRAIAEMLMQQSMTPIEAPVVKGRFQGAVSPFSGLAKMLQAYTSGQGIADADKAGAGIAEKYRTGLADAVTKYSQAKAGTPEIPSPADALGGGPGAPAVAGDARKAIIEAMSSPYAPVQRIGQMDLQQLNRAEDRKDTQTFQADQAKLQREQRTADLEARLADSRTTAQERMALQRELAQMQISGRQELARLAASLKPAPAEKQVKTMDTVAGPVIINPDGTTKPVLGADGKPLGAKKGAAPLSATAQKELFEADDVANSSQNAIQILRSIVTPDAKTGKSQNDLAYEGGTANVRRAAMSFVPINSAGENATVDLTNKVTGQALEQLKAVFGGMPTEGERKVLMELQGSVNQKAPQRKEIFERAIKLAERRMALSQDKAKRLREGTYFGAGTATNQDGNPNPLPANQNDPLGILGR